MIKKIFVVIFFFFIFQNVYAEEKIAVVDIDYLINNSKAGKYIQTSFQKINDKSIKEFKVKEEEFKKKQNQLISQKNVMSKEEFNKKVKDLNMKINEYNNNKQKTISNSNKKRNKAKLTSIYRRSNHPKGLDSPKATVITSVGSATPFLQKQGKIPYANT